MQNMMKERRQQNLMNLLLAFIMLRQGGGTGRWDIPIELSSLMYNFLAANDNNSLRVIVTGKRVGEEGLVVPTTRQQRFWKRS